VVGGSLTPGAGSRAAAPWLQAWSASPAATRLL